MLRRSLQLNGHVIISPTADRLYDDLAEHLFMIANEAIADREVFHVALSGGSTPEPFYQRLVIDPRYRFLPWQRTHVWIVDERRVPADDDRCNFKMIRESLLDHVPMRSRQIHPVPVLVEDPAGAYEAELRRHVGDGRLDFVLLGMGDDGHTASLFPGSPAQDERNRWIAVNQGPAVTPPERVTMTYPLLNSARHLAVLITGEKKTIALRQVERQLRDNGPDPLRLPITGIAPAQGVVCWFLDAAAAGDNV